MGCGASQVAIAPPNGSNTASGTDTVPAANQKAHKTTKATANTAASTKGKSAADAGAAVAGTVSAAGANTATTVPSEGFFDDGGDGDTAGVDAAVPEPEPEPEPVIVVTDPMATPPSLLALDIKAKFDAKDPDHWQAFLARAAETEAYIKALDDLTPKRPLPPLPADVQYVRPFLSSTFRDFNDERDIVFKSAFAQVEKLTVERGLFFAPLDLRWGITNEQSSGGEVIKICLEEIDRSRPYFVCSIGFRNGWALHPLDDPKASWVQLLETTFDLGTAAFPWVADYKDRSVTELEILHGMLRDETRHLTPRPFVYMRSVKYLRDLVPLDQRGTYAEMGWAEKQLYALKRAIVLAGFQIKYFDTPEEWAELVKNDFIASLERDFPLAQFSPLDREIKDHRSFGGSRTRCFLGRKSYFDKLDAYLAAPVGSADDKPIVLVAESGMGKSAILANWVASLRARQDGNSFPGARWVPGARRQAGVGFGGSAQSASTAAALKAEAASPSAATHGLASFKKRPSVASPEAVASGSSSGVVDAAPASGMTLDVPTGTGAVPVSARASPSKVGDVVHLNLAVVQARFIGATSDSTLASTLLLWVLEELNSALGPFYIDGELAQVPSSAQELYEQWPLWLEAATAKAPLVLVFDGLDQLAADNDGHYLTWLPMQFPPGVKVICATVPNHLTFEQVKRRGFQPLPVVPLSIDEAKALCVEYLGLFGKQLDNTQLTAILANARVRNPLYLLTFLQEVRVFGSFEALTSRIDLYMGSASITDMFLRVIKHLEEDFDSPAAPHLVRYTLCIMACARAGINERELKASVETALCLGDGNFPTMTFAALMIRLESSLIDQHGLKIFSHSYLRDAIVQYYLGVGALAPAPVKVSAALAAASAAAAASSPLAGTASPVSPISRLSPASSGSPSDSTAAATVASAATGAGARGNGSRLVSAPYGRELRVYCHQLLANYFMTTPASSRKVQELPWHVYILCLLSAQANADPETAKIAIAAAEASASSAAGSAAGSGKGDRAGGSKLKMAKKSKDKAGVSSAAADADAVDPGAAEATAASRSAASADSIMAITTLPAGAFGIIDAALADRLAELLTDVSLFPIFKLTEFKFDLHKFWQILERSSPGRKYARPAKAYYTALKRFQDENQDISPTEFSKLCHDIGAFLASTDRYHGADVFFDQALAIDKREKGATHPDIELLTTLKANLLYKQGRYQEALPLYEDSLKIIEKNAALLDATRGPVLRIALANLLKEQGQVEDALALYSKSMQKQKATLGDSHPVVAVSMTNMADMYLRLDGAESLAKAVKLYEGALKIMETHKGKTHPVVGSIVASMGSVYDRLSQYGTAMAYFERALKIKETAFGRDHVGNCVVLNNMATTMVNQGRYKDALALYKRSLDIREKTQGIDHPHVAPTLANIARLYSSMADARIAAAEQRKLRESAGTGSAAGDGDGDGSRSDDHELDASTAAIGLDSQPDGAGSTPGADDAEVVQYIAAAVTSFKRAVSIIDTAFGPTHISLVDVLDDLAKAHSRADMHMEALADYQRMIQIYSQQQRLQESSAESATPAKPDKAGKAAAGKPPVGGKAGKGSKGATAPSGGDAPMSGLSVEIAGVLGKQAQVYASGLGNVHKAIECITTQCEILEALQGSDSTELADALFVLSSMYLDVERELDSLRCIRRCYSIRVAHPKLGLEHNDTLEAKTWLYDIAVVDQDACPFDEFDPATFDFDNCHVNVVATMPLSESDNSPEASRSRPQAAASGIKTGGSARNTALSGAAASAAGTKSKARSGMKALLTDED